MSHGVEVKSVKPVRCPNEYCDPGEGCCVCEYTGWIYEWVLEDMTLPDGPFTVRERHNPVHAGNVPLARGK